MRSRKLFKGIILAGIIPLLLACGGEASKKENLQADFQVISTTPAAGSAGVLSPTITITFNREVNGTTVDGTTLTMDNGLTGTIETTANTVTITTGGYSAAVVYTISVGTGITDTGGDPLVSPYSFSFTASSLLAGILANYHLDGDTLDSSPNAKHLNNYGLTSSTSGHIGGAMAGDGTAAYARTLYDFSAGNTSDVTVSLWMKRVDDCLCVPLAVGGMDWNLMQLTSWTDGTTSGVQAGFGYIGNTPFVEMPFGSFHHVVIEYSMSSATTTLWVDNTATPLSYGPGGNARGGLILSASLNATSSIHAFFNGDVDEVVVWNRKLDATERAELYNGGAGVAIP